MDYQFSSNNYNIFIKDEVVNDDKFYKDIIHILADNDKSNMPPEFWDIDTIDDAKIWYSYITSQSDVLFIQSKYTQKTIGYIFIHVEEEKSHLGYVLSKDYWNKGVATEVLISFIEFCNETKKWDNFFAGVHRDNTASINLLEKLGFTITEESPMILFYEYRI